jgi:hypothetical protein
MVSKDKDGKNRKVPSLILSSLKKYADSSTVETNFKERKDRHEEVLITPQKKHWLA